MHQMSSLLNKEKLIFRVKTMPMLLLNHCWSRFQNRQKITKCQYRGLETKVNSFPLIYNQVSYDFNSSWKLCRSKDTPFLHTGWLNPLAQALTPYHKFTKFLCPLNYLSCSVGGFSTYLQSLTFCYTLYQYPKKKKKKWYPKQKLKYGNSYRKDFNYVILDSDP
jgi:hypothetical protein